MKFPYLKQPSSLRPGAPWISRPLIPVRLFHSDKQVTVYALIDSGADVSVFHSSIARGLGIDPGFGRRSQAYGISGRAQGVEVYYHQVRLQVVGSMDTIEVEVGFAESSGIGALFGQSGFFEHYRVAFDRSTEEIDIVPVRTGSKI